jgi:hypothetical protein
MSGESDSMGKTIRLGYWQRHKLFSKIFDLLLLITIILIPIGLTGFIFGVEYSLKISLAAFVWFYLLAAFVWFWVLLLLYWVAKVGDKPEGQRSDIYP